LFFFAGFGDQFGSNLSPIGEVPGVLRPQNNAMYNFGRSMDNKASYVWGLGEIVYGAVLTGGGGAAALHTLGTSLTVSVAGISTTKAMITTDFRPIRTTAPIWMIPEPTTANAPFVLRPIRYGAALSMEFM